ncbi:UDP-N-acetylmuramoyl-L-alanyl-D-glutamate--2,6-diaminopimelate ligase [endosymbiont of Tevnia jerichonana (vent Tica)]|jgi:UDP-N-acetylmuramoyl-L-alanyl-D-glutamate--2,6-diaminopimelate ligase|uniref:UDP-N-acetylmuramoyl-L-alanyl-D-glutamate--2,6-diaminopimelate ligase n=2 Tax=Gammaproteobacteria TaxID=1236 RepID=G2FET8_9GAMM|nr:UDP-N-acetylmuramoyl-L-alanyl-D-glutamate--2,6-diaminopimelate ligase [endosymbiont of Tevnia jerichonana (vent Tica)]
MKSAMNRSQTVSLQDLLAGLAEIDAAQERPISCLAIDSRNLCPGGLFLACQGGDRHGLDFTEQALAQGAVAIAWEPNGPEVNRQAERLATQLPIPLIRVEGLTRLASLIAARFFAYPSRSMTVIGVTGTNGKTSVSHLLAQALDSEARCGVVGTLGAGFPEALEATGYTTPDAVSVQGLLAELKAKGARSVAMEISSHALHQSRVEAVHFDIAVFTNLSRDHFDYHGSFGNYAAAKRRLFQMPDLRCAVLNMDQPFGLELLGSLAGDVDAVGYSADLESAFPERLSGWIRAERILPTARGMEIQLESSWGSGLLQTELMGSFNADNLLAALAVLLYKGWDWSEAIAALASIKTIAGRLERFEGEAGPMVIVDYAHTPDALQKALEVLRGHCQGSLSVVFGCGGDRDRGKRPQMGAVAERLADRVILTDDNPRSEASETIIQQILSGMQQPDMVQVETDRAQAIRLAVESAGTDDLVLIAGKGHERWQEIGDRRIPFDDREQVQRLLGIAAEGQQ